MTYVPVSFTFDCKAPRDVDREGHIQSFLLFLCRARTIVWNERYQEARENAPIAVGTLLYHILSKQQGWISCDRVRPFPRLNDWERMGSWRSHPVYLDTKCDARTGIMLSNKGKTIIKMNLVNA